MKKSYSITLAIFGIAFLLVLLVSISLLGSLTSGGWGMMSGWPSGMMHGWGFSSFGWIGIILILLIPVGFVVLVVLGIVGLVRGLTSGRSEGLLPYQMAETQLSSHEILQIRYVREEITREQYLKMLDDMN